MAGASRTWSRPLRAAPPLERLAFPEAGHRSASALLPLHLPPTSDSANGQRPGNHALGVLGLFPALAILTAMPGGPEAQGQLRAALGAELDTNARRAIPLGSMRAGSAPIARPTEVVEDGLARLSLDLAGSLGWRAHELYVRYRLGAKRFMAEASEDLLAQDLSLASRHELSRLWVLSSFLRGRSSRMRSGVRDYDLAQGGAELTFSPGLFDVTATAFVRGFFFAREPRFNHFGPTAKLEAGWRPASMFRVLLSGGRAWRSYAGNGLVVGRRVTPSSASNVVTFCDDDTDPAIQCMSRPRSDEEWQVSVGAQYTGDLILTVGYLFRSQRSSSELENIDRHRFSAQATVALPLELMLSLQVALQINDGLTPTGSQFLAEDDEEQNSIQVQLKREMVPGLDVELRYALFGNQFQNNTDLSFQRQTFYLGVAARIETQ